MWPKKLEKLVEDINEKISPVKLTMYFEKENQGDILIIDHPKFQPKKYYCIYGSGLNGKLTVDDYENTYNSLSEAHEVNAK